MMIYSIRISIVAAREPEWLEYMQTHMVEVLATGYFDHAVLKKLRDAKIPTYVVEYATTDLERYREYQAKAAPALQQEHAKKFGGQFSADRKLYEIIGKR